jgi:RNA polymerase sigma factor (sigma-70 family)
LVLEPVLIEELRAGERAAVKQLYTDYFGYCTSFVLKNRGDTEHARDLFQEALIVLFNKLRNPEFKLTCAVKTYLYSVVRNLWLKRLHKESRGGLQLIMDKENEKEFIVVQEDNLEEKQVDEEKHQAVARGMKAIKEDCQQLLMNFYFKKISLSNIADQMGYTYQFIKVKKNRCMEALKKKVRAFQQKEK